MIILDFEKTASFDIDCQKGFTNICPDELPVPGGETIVSEVNATAKFAKYRIGSKDWHPNVSLHMADKEHPQFSPVNLPNIDIRWNRHCIGNEKGSELLEGLPNWNEYDYFVWKGLQPDTHPYSAIYHDLQKKLSTGVIEWLTVNNISTVLAVGIATDFCLKETAIDLAKKGFRVIVNMAATKAINAQLDSGETTLTIAIKEMKTYNIQFIDNALELIQ